MELEHFRDLGIALALGLLVGLQREWARKEVAGIRTFPLITTFGALCAIIGEAIDSTWIVVTGLAVVAAMFLMGDRLRLAANKPDPGQTTEVAGVVMFIVGALVVRDLAGLAVVTTGVVAVLLHWKAPLHDFVGRMSDDDLRAIVRLVLIGMVILPILPDRTYGPYEVLNPFEIWLMVVLIVGISMAAWVVQRVLGPKVGTLLGGILGGLISSTATTVGYATRSRGMERGHAGPALVIMIASTVVFARVLVEVAVVAPGLLARVAPPLVVMMIFMAIVCGAAFFASRSELAAPIDEDEPPSALGSAVIFGLLYAGVLFAVAAVKADFGDTAMYGVAFASGLTDMDAITLSTAQLMKADRLEIDTGWRLIMVGAMANLVFKGIAVFVLGAARLGIRVAILFAISLAGGGALLAFWPA